MSSPHADLQKGENFINVDYALASASSASLPSHNQREMVEAASAAHGPGPMLPDRFLVGARCDLLDDQLHFWMHAKKKVLAKLLLSALKSQNHEYILKKCIITGDFNLRSPIVWETETHPPVHLSAKPSKEHQSIRKLPPFCLLKKHGRDRAVRRNDCEQHHIASGSRLKGVTHRRVCATVPIQVRMAGLPQDKPDARAEYLVSRDPEIRVFEWDGAPMPIVTVLFAAFAPDLHSFYRTTMNQLGERHRKQARRRPKASVSRGPRIVPTDGQRGMRMYRKWEEAPRSHQLVTGVANSVQASPTQYVVTNLTRSVRVGTATSNCLVPIHRNLESTDWFISPTAPLVFFYQFFAI
ncbi:hypothetical protein C8F04DRAFT_1194488 [Mycena alexandri]|uniref:Uncharacterized protein n=1 Tax=Mycena alexandri TaxID=1745969 RepID=A0AAD6WVD6_9AGAR|nr:hypothetical protein C8F04DRAFT_1194488 [Mycena alexandri]